MRGKREYKFTVPGRAVPKGRPRLGRGGRVFTPQKTLDYEALVRRYAEEVIDIPMESDDLYISVQVYIKGRNHADLDNLVKSILDGLNRVAYLDDKQIKHIDAHLRFISDKKDERVEVRIYD